MPISVSPSHETASHAQPATAAHLSQVSISAPFNYMPKSRRRIAMRARINTFRAGPTGQRSKKRLRHGQYDVTLFGRCLEVVVSMSNRRFSDSRQWYARFPLSTTSRMVKGGVAFRSHVLQPRSKRSQGFIPSPRCLNHMHSPAFTGAREGDAPLQVRASPATLRVGSRSGGQPVHVLPL
jgi:hypothetical protein